MVTREDREAAAGFADYAGGDDVPAWVESGRWPRAGIYGERRSSLDNAAQAFAAHRARERARIREAVAKMPATFLGASTHGAVTLLEQDAIMRIVDGADEEVCGG